MEVQIKKTIKAGNSSAVVLPRSWLNKEVRVELIKKTPELILSNVIDIAKNHIKIEDIIGIYLTGSYARGEEDKDSDIDVLIITDNIDREIINEGIYSILIISSELLQQKLSKDLFPVGAMLKEAKPLLNAHYLDGLNLKVTRNNVLWYLDTTKDKLAIIKKVIYTMKGNNQKYVNDKVIYTLVLRIRTMYIIRRLMENKNYSKKEFIKMIEKISKGTNAYEGYLRVKNNLKEKKGTSIEETERLYKYLENQLSEVQKSLRNK
ncbi:MAG: nucleotidyltransferase domain-containing protein [Nanoarchaeota archaeon]|nr:nucleotidyltransferase domain-containing protein [Nanoarchaeota archaeon]